METAINRVLTKNQSIMNNETNQIMRQHIYKSIINYRLDMLLCHNLEECINTFIQRESEDIQYQIDNDGEVCLYELDKIITEQNGRKDDKKYQLWICDDTTDEENYIIACGDTLQSILDDRCIFVQCLQSYLQKREEYNETRREVFHFCEKLGNESNPFVDERLNQTSKVIYSSVIEYYLVGYELENSEQHRIGLDVRELL